MKKLCLFILLLITIVGKINADIKDPVLQADTTTTDRAFVLQLNDWKAKTIEVVIRKQGGSVVFTDQLDASHTTTTRYVFNELEEGTYQVVLKGRSKFYTQQFYVKNQQLLLAEGGLTKGFSPVLNQPQPNVDFTLKVKEQWYQQYNK